MLEEQRRSW